jgi:hypothetical protein
MSESGWSWQWLPSWLSHMRPRTIKTLRASDAMHEECVQNRFRHFLDHTEPPKTFRAAEVAQELSDNELISMGMERWEEVLPAIVELAFEMRDLGFCKVFQKGKELPDHYTAYDVEGSVRVMRRDDDILDDEARLQ